MAAPTNAITRMFTRAVRSEPFFRGWKKQGVRRYWDQSGPIHQGIELTLFKHSWDNDQAVGLGVHLGYPTGVQPLVPGFGGDNVNGVFVATTYVSPTVGMGVPTFASDRAWHLHEEEDIERLRSQMPSLFTDIVIPWFQQHRDEVAFFDWYFAEHPMPSSLPLVLAKHGPAAARRVLAEWIAESPQQRGGDRLVNWLETTGLLEPEMWSRFRLADMQAWEDYCLEMKEIARELLSAGT
jgi:hypothetical protein